MIDGLPAEMVALALPLDVDRISAAGLIDADWRGRYPSNATVCETTVALVVRPGNPKNITDWQDLTRPGVEVWRQRGGGRSGPQQPEVGRTLWAGKCRFG